MIGELRITTRNNSVRTTADFAKFAACNFAEEVLLGALYKLFSEGGRIQIEVPGEPPVYSEISIESTESQD